MRQRLIRRLGIALMVCGAAVPLAVLGLNHFQPGSLLKNISIAVMLIELPLLIIGLGVCAVGWDD